LSLLDLLDDRDDDGLLTLWLLALVAVFSPGEVMALAALTNPVLMHNSLALLVNLLRVLVKAHLVSLVRDLRVSLLILRLISLGFNFTTAYLS